MPESITYNCDCLAYMRTLPDNAFDLAVADPPYGDGLHAEDGGGKGWFTKYNQRVNNSSQTVQVERERESRSITASETPEAYSSDTSVNRTGGTRATKYGKKLSRGTLRREKITSKNFSASHAIRSFGAGITLSFRLPGAF